MFDEEEMSDVSSDDEKFPAINNDDKSPDTSRPTRAKNKRGVQAVQDGKSASKEGIRKTGRTVQPSLVAIEAAQTAALLMNEKIQAAARKEAAIKAAAIKAAARKTALTTMLSPLPNIKRGEPDSQNSKASSVLGPGLGLGVTSATYSQNSQGSTETFNMGANAYKESATALTSTQYKHINPTDMRNEVSQKKTQPGQFNSVWETGSKGVLNIAKTNICYICGCPISKKGGADGHFPEMEHFITPGEFFMKFGTELVCNGSKNIFEKGNIGLYNAIHTQGSDGTEPLEQRIDRVNRILNTDVIEDRVKTPLKQFSTTYLLKDGTNTIIYDKSFFVPQIKSYLTQFVYAHHICNQIKGHMPTLQGSIDLEFDSNGVPKFNQNQEIFYKYADILYEVINTLPKKVERASGTPYHNNFNDGKKCYIAAPNPNQYTIEALYINGCWEGTSKDEIKRRIVDNMLLHSKILREQRFECTVQRLKNFDYIRGFTTLIPEDINKGGSTPPIQPIINRNF